MSCESSLADWLVHLSVPVARPQGKCSHIHHTTCGWVVMSFNTHTQSFWRITELRNSKQIMPLTSGHSEMQLYILSFTLFVLKFCTEIKQKLYLAFSLLTLRLHRPSKHDRMLRAAQGWEQSSLKWFCHRFNSPLLFSMYMILNPLYWG